MEKKYIIDMANNLDADEMGMIIAVVKKTPIPTDEVIARAYEWLDKKDFIEFMDFWKHNDFKPLVYGNLDDDCDHFIVAIEHDDTEVRIYWWER